MRGGASPIIDTGTTGAVGAAGATPSTAPNPYRGSMTTSPRGGAAGITPQRMRRHNEQVIREPGMSAPLVAQEEVVEETPDFSIDSSDLQQVNLQGMSFDPYRQQALRDINAQSAAALAGAQTNLAQTGGLSAADRMNLASRFNRDKIMGRQQALGKYAGMEAQSAYDADKANQMFNAGLLNENLYRNMAAKERVYGYEKQDDMLDRQLEASGAMADATAAAANKKPGGLLGGSVIPGIL